MKMGNQVVFTDETISQFRVGKHRLVEYLRWWDDEHVYLQINGIKSKKLGISKQKRRRESSIQGLQVGGDTDNEVYTPIWLISLQRGREIRISRKFKSSSNLSSNHSR